MIAHGEASYYWLDNILVCQLNGAFNEEGLLRALIERNKFIAQKEFDTWYRILTCSSEVFGSPQVMEMLNRSENDLLKQGCVCTFYVFANDFQVSMRQQNMKSSKLAAFFVTTLDEAVGKIEQIKTQAKSDDD